MNLLISAAAFTSETRRLFIRPLGVEDRDIYCFLYTDAEMMRFIGQPLPLERAQRSFLKAVELSSRQPLVQLFLAIIDKSSGERLGVCSIQKFKASTAAAEVGIMLKPGARRRSIAKEALTALIDAVFAHLHAEEVWAETSDAHASAVGLFERLRFSRAPGASSRLIWTMPRRCWRT